MQNQPTISILIPAYNEESFLPQTLHSVHASFAAISRSDYEIVVCDNNSTDATSQIALAGNAHVVFEPHNGFSHSRNAAARAARGEWFIFLDADTLLSPQLLRVTLDHLATGKVGGGGAAVNLDTNRPGWFGAMFCWSWNRLSSLRKLAPGPYTFCLRRVWQETGGFPEDVYYTEDIIFSKRLQRWCRAHNMRVTIITEASALTSSRKLEWFTTGQLIRQLLTICIPGSIKRRDHLHIWYRRPAAASKNQTTNKAKSLASSKSSA